MIREIICSQKKGILCICVLLDWEGRAHLSIWHTSYHTVLTQTHTDTTFMIYDVCMYDSDRLSSFLIFPFPPVNKCLATTFPCLVVLLVVAASLAAPLSFFLFFYLVPLSRGQRLQAQNSWTTSAFHSRARKCDDDLRSGSMHGWILFVRISFRAWLRATGLHLVLALELYDYRLSTIVTVV